MLAYILAIIVAIGSFSFYMAAFFVPEMHRRQDFFWSGLGLFYAVVLWFCAGRLSGAVLLGQVASVALLGGLGWHTLELRRDLTPEPVQTPVSWEDLQKWVRSLQQQASQYLHLEAIADRGQAIVRTLSGLLASLGSIPTPAEQSTSSEVPPLKRSPAYEFETASGDGQSIPSEFATVASRRRPAVNPAADDVPDEAAADALEDEPAATAAIADESPKSAASQTDADNASEGQPPAVPGKQSVDMGSTAEKSAPAKTAKRSAEPDSTTISPAKAADQKANPIAGMVSRVTNVFKGQRPPKPQRGVIEIPPRAPSIPRTDAEQSTAASAKPPTKPKRSAKSSRAVIDIPPRPPSIPRSPTAKTAEPSAQPPATEDSQPAADANWVDTGDRSPSETAPRDASLTAPTGASAEQADAPAETNWPDDNADWSDERDSAVADNVNASQPSTATDDTNWPDDDDTNWPD